MTYQKARIEDYGYKDHTTIYKIWKIIMKVIVVLAVILIYASTIVIFFHSINKSSNFEWTGFTLKWYGEIFKVRALYTSIINTLIISLSATAISTVLGTLAAVGISTYETKKRRRIMLLNNIPLLNADIVTGVSLMLIFSIINLFWPYFFGWKTMLLAHIYFTLPYVILSVLPKLRELDPNLFDAACDLGIKPTKALYKVVVPAIKAGIFSGIVLAFTMSFDDFVISYYCTGNGFDNLSIWIYSSIAKRMSPAVYAFTSLVTIISLIFVVIYAFVAKGKKKNEKHK